MMMMMMMVVPKDIQLSNKHRLVSKYNNTDLTTIQFVSYLKFHIAV